jgi:hypothetical protein
MVVLFSTHSAKILNSAEIIELYKKTAFHIYLALFAFFWAFTEYTYVQYHKGRVEGKRYWKHGLVEPVCYCLASALVGAFAVVNAKCLSMLIQVSSSGDNEFAKPALWIILVTWIIFVLYWLRRLDYGFEIFPPLFVIPVVQCFFIFFAIICGGIFFEEFMVFTPSQFGGFFAGVVLILGGVYGLAPTDMDTVGQIVPVDYDEDDKIPSDKPEVPTAQPLEIESKMAKSEPPTVSTAESDILEMPVNNNSSKRKIIKHNLE